ncbi:MAG: VOC family protein [Burkholderiales bacterium]
MQNAVNWFEIPVADLARATRFYEAVFGKTLRQESMGPASMAVFPYEQEGVGGCLYHAPQVLPSAQGSIVYLDANPSIDAALERVLAERGRVSLPKTALPPGMGYFAHIVDSEGNRVGLHALQ